MRDQPPFVCRRIRPRRAPSYFEKLIFAVGADETEEFLRQQAVFVAAWDRKGLVSHVVNLPGRHHFSAIDALGEQDHALFRTVRDMILR